MASIISTKTSGGGGIAVTGDTSGVLEIQSNNGTTAVTISTGQVVSFVNNFGTVAGYPSYQCRAWVNFNGTGTVAIRASGNVSSITDNGTGDYTVNFTTAMPDVNYATNVTTDTSSAGNYSNYSNTLFGQSSASAIRVISTSNSTAYSDVPRIAVSVFR